MNRTLTIKNFKQYNEAEFVIEGQLIMFMGKNGSGKSSAMQALESVLMLKSFVKEPVNNKTGATNADIKYTGQDLTGNPITISIHIEKDGVYSFSAACIKDGKPKSITDVKKIKELIGTYYPLTVEEVLNMVKFAEGRRTFIKEYLNPLLKENLAVELVKCQTSISGQKNKSTENNLYHTRTEVSKKIELLGAEIGASEISEEDKKEVAVKQKVIDKLAELSKEYEDHKQDPDKITGILNTMQSIDTHWKNYVIAYRALQSLIGTDSDDGLKAMDKGVNSAIEQLSNEKGILYSLDTLNALKDRISNGKIKLANIESIEKRSEPTEKIAERDRLFKQLETINADMEKNKARIKEIYTISSFPAGLEIDEDTILLNGFLLDDTTNSNTEVRLAILDLLCNISTAEYVCVGDWSLYDKESRSKVLKLAQGHKRIFMGQLISEDTEVKLETLIID